MIDFPALLRALHENGVRFLIVGGAAATAHGAAGGGWVAASRSGAPC